LPSGGKMSKTLEKLKRKNLSATKLLKLLHNYKNKTENMMHQERMLSRS